MSRAERALIKKLKKRDERAFREVMRLHQDRVFSITLRMMGNRFEAEDITQEVFITVFKSIDGFREDSKFSTWVYRIAVNHCKNRIKYYARRKSERQGEYDDSAANQGANHAVVPNRSRTPQQSAELTEVGGELQRAISSLSEQSKTLVVLRDIEELSYQEISEIMEMPVGTVKSRLHRARVTLRGLLEGYVGDGEQ